MHSAFHYACPDGRESLVALEAFYAPSAKTLGSFADSFQSTAFTGAPSSPTRFRHGAGFLSSFWPDQSGGNEALGHCPGCPDRQPACFGPGIDLVGLRRSEWSGMDSSPLKTSREVSGATGLPRRARILKGRPLIRMSGRSDTDATEGHAPTLRRHSNTLRGFLALPRSVRSCG